MIAPQKQLTTTRAITNTIPGLRENLCAARGWAYASAGDYDHALADWSAAIALEPTSDSYIQRAELYAALSNTQAAEADHTSAIKLSPTVGKYYYMRAEFYAKRARIEEALADYAAFLRLSDPDVPQEAIDKAQEYVEQYGSSQTPATTPTLTPTPTTGPSASLLIHPERQAYEQTTTKMAESLDARYMP
ncbi:MAG: tetratricopeptide repeat protein [Caldilineaceae bacterium]